MIRSISVFSLAAAVTVFALAPGLAHGYRRSQAAFTCAPYNSDDQWGSYAISNNALSGTKVYACGVDSDSQHHPNNVVSTQPIAIRGSAYMAEGIYAQACVSYSSIVGGACGGVTANLTVGSLTLFPSASAWTSASSSDIPHLIVALAGCRSNGTGSCLAWNLVRGYHVDYN